MTTRSSTPKKSAKKTPKKPASTPEKSVSSTPKKLEPESLLIGLDLKADFCLLLTNFSSRGELAGVLPGSWKILLSAVREARLLTQMWLNGEICQNKIIKRLAEFIKTHEAFTIPDDLQQHYSTKVWDKRLQQNGLFNIDREIPDEPTGVARCDPIVNEVGPNTRYKEKTVKCHWVSTPSTGFKKSTRLFFRSEEFNRVGNAMTSSHTAKNTVWTVFGTYGSGKSTAVRELSNTFHLKLWEAGDKFPIERLWPINGERPLISELRQLNGDGTILVWLKLDELGESFRKYTDLFAGIKALTQLPSVRVIVTGLDDSVCRYSPENDLQFDKTLLAAGSSPKEIIWALDHFFGKNSPIFGKLDRELAGAILCGPWIILEFFLHTAWVANPFDTLFTLLENAYAEYESFWRRQNNIVESKMQTTAICKAIHNPDNPIIKIDHLAYILIQSESKGLQKLMKLHNSEIPCEPLCKAGLFTKLQDDGIAVLPPCHFVTRVLNTTAEQTFFQHPVLYLFSGLKEASGQIYELLWAFEFLHSSSPIYRKIFKNSKYVVDKGFRLE
ncbi:hypothetical protein Pelo_16230 [Pelomyxa schiedti]|nr:hypothetical protein Pelo_16230 [Pelomyxa schiedti]